jgi:hypothetical protein
MTYSEKVTQNNLNDIINKVNALQLGSDFNRVMKLENVLSFNDGIEFSTITTSEMAIATMVSYYGRKMTVRSGYNCGLQLGWITQNEDGTFTVTC